MAKTDLPYDLAAVRRLLLAAFTAEDLRRFCQDRPAFRPILTRLSAHYGLDDIVEEVIDYCDRHLLLDELLEAVRQENPAQYTRYEPQLRATGADEIALKILKPGSVLLSGRYRIVRHIARGGFGSVYLAEDTLLREQVAIKELIPALVGDEAALKRFLVEAKAMMQLAHPHIVHTRDVFEAGGNYYMVMEHMPGGSLEDQIKERKALPVDEAVRILAEVCEGLAYAHARGVVHCDLKPSNILLAAGGSAKVTDFGVAHVSDQMVTKSWITHGGFAGGTLPYMSPEQTDGVRDDPRVDVYALGAVLYRALTGRMYLDFDQRDTPRAQSDNVQRIYAQQPVPPSALNPRVPAWLDAVVLKALAKQPGDRYAGAAELRSALLSPQTGPAGVTPPPIPRPAPAPRPAATVPADLVTRLRRVPAWLWLAAGGAVVLLIFLAVAIPKWVDGGQDATATPTWTPAPATATPTQTEAAPTPTPTYTEAPPSATPTYTEAPPTPTPTYTEVPPTPTPTYTEVPPTPTPTYTEVPPTATPTRTEVPPTAKPSRQGRIAFTSDRDGNYEIYTMNADGSGLTRLTNNGIRDLQPAWSPDGRRIAFVSDQGGNREIYVMNADGSGLTRLTYEAAYDHQPAWSPDGLHIAFTSTRDGSLNANIYVMNADGSGQTRLTDNPTNDQSPAWSPDGRRIAFESDRDRNWEIYVMNADGSGQARLTNKEAVDVEPAWSPKGERIAFTRGGWDSAEVYVMNADGSGQTNLTNSAAADHMGGWSPDGRYIVFASGRDGNSEIYIMNADGSGVTRLTKNPAYDAEPAWSPK